MWRVIFRRSGFVIKYCFDKKWRGSIINDEFVVNDLVS